MNRRLIVTVAVSGVVVGAALLGRTVVPADEALRTAAAPWAPRQPGLFLGTDGLGRDVAARVFAGGRSLVLISLVAAALTSGLGTAVGLWNGWTERRSRAVAEMAGDVALSVPFLLAALLAAAALPWHAAVVVATIIGGSPLTMRVVGDATRTARSAGYVEAALVRGERVPTILVREVLPAHLGLVGADLAVRFVMALQIASALAILGFGSPPPDPDWAGMLRENLAGGGLNPAAVLAPAAALSATAAAVAAVAQVLSEQDRT